MTEFSLPRITAKRLILAVGLILCGVGAAMVAVAWAYKTGRVSVRKHPGPPVLIERQGDVIATGALSALYPLDFEQIPLPYADLQGRGGAMFHSETATFHMRRNGVIYRIDSGGMSKLAVDPAFDLAASAARVTRAIEKWFMGVRSAQIVQTPEGWRLLVSYFVSHPEKPCLQIVMAMQTFTGAQFTGASGDGWTEIFFSDSCSVPGATLRAGEAGGGMIVRGSKVYIAVGPIGSDSEATRQALADGTATSANQPSGQIFEVDLETGETVLFANGFRNIIGLITGNDRSLWSLEHGPRGGDELNHVMRGRHHGWPLTTFGTDYTGFTWLGSDAPGRHTGFPKPVFAWVPSIAPSALRRIEGRQFSNWTGDIIVSSLKAGRLYRLHLEGDRVLLEEPILIGRRIRDFVEGHDGALYLLLARDGLVIKVTAGEADAGIEGAAALNLCASCHQLQPQDDGTYSGPTLVGVIGRKIATVPGFLYSDVLAKADGRWTTETLHRFLENPEVFGTGSTMPGSDLSFSQRRLVILGLQALDAKDGNDAQ